MPDVVRDNKVQHRFEMDAGDDIAVAYYSLTPGVITFTHTEVPAALRGQGIGSRLVRGALEDRPRPGPQGRAALLFRLRLSEPAP